MKKLTALLLAALLVLPLSRTAVASETVQAQIDSLPTVEEFQAMDLETQNQVYLQTQDAYEAYLALPEEEQARIQGMEETFGPLFAHFSTMIEYAGETEAPEAPEDTLGQSPRALALPILLAAAFLLGKGKKRK